MNYNQKYLTLTQDYQLFKKDQTSEIARHIIDVAHDNDIKIILLKGNLGAGKTHISKQILQELSDCKVQGQSPTYDIVHTYKHKDQTFHHLDLYRIKNINEILELGLEDILNSDMAIIEWPEILESSINKKSKVIVSLRHGEDDTRLIKINIDLNKSKNKNRPH